MASDRKIRKRLLKQVRELEAKANAVRQRKSVAGDAMAKHYENKIAELKSQIRAYS